MLNRTRTTEVNNKMNNNSLNSFSDIDPRYTAINSFLNVIDIDNIPPLYLRLNYLLNSASTACRIHYKLLD